MTVAREMRHAARRLARRPGLAILATALLAVGLGGNLALLSVLDAILFRQAPVVEPERLVRVLRTDSGRNFLDNWSYPNADDLRRNATTITDAAIFADWRRIHLKLAGEDAVRISASVVTGNYFELLGARPALGRLLTRSDDSIGSPSPVAVIAHDLWRTRLGSDPAVIGTEIGLNGQPFTIVGVAPEGLRSLDPTLAPEVWVPMTAWTTLLTNESRRDLLVERGSSWLDLIARLAPGATEAAAQSELDARIAALAGEYPDLLMVESADGVEPARAWVMPVTEARVGGPTEAPRVGRQAALVAGIGGLVLLIIAANLAALITARAGQLRHETAVRAALGASPVRLVQPLVLEGVLLATSGAILALPLAAMFEGVATRSLGFVLPLAEVPGLGLLASPRILMVGAALVAAVVLLVGALPGLIASRFSLVPALRREELSRPRSRLGASDLLVATQAAMSVVLLLAASILIARFRELARVDPGFDSESVVQASYDLGLQGYSEARAAVFHEEVLRRTKATLGESRVALTDWTPLAGGWSRTSIRPEGYEATPGERPNADVSWVSPNLFEVLRIRLERGRLFSDVDSANAPPVAVINATMARRYFAGRDPIGASFRIGSSSPGIDPVTVVGVVSDVRYRDLRSDVPPMFFRPLAQSPSAQTRLSLLARSDSPTAALTTLRSLLRELDADLPLYRAGLLNDQAASSIGEERRAATLFASFAALVLVLAAAGLGALALVSVARRRREIGVRMALGASGSSVVSLLLRRTAWIVGGGCATGLVIAALLLPRVGELAGADLDLSPSLLGAALGLLFGAALVATWLPARRALSIDPVEVLRNE